MPKINVYLPDDLAAAVRDTRLPVSAICQEALARAVREVTAIRAAELASLDDATADVAFNRFTPRARLAVKLAGDVARDQQCESVDTQHLLLGMIVEGSNLALKVLAALELEVEDLRAELDASMTRGTSPSPAGIPFTALLKQAFELAKNEALGLGHNYIGCEHLLLGLLATEDGLASKVLRRMGIELRTTRRAVISALAGFLHTGSVATPATDATLKDIVTRLDALEQRLPPPD
jgi:ATP-dependent Clp protease ATP-binding subunit ClpC